MAKTKLNQIIAVESGEKTRSHRDLTEVYQLLQKNALLQGIARTYTPYDDEGETLPPESTRVQLRASDTLTQVAENLTRLFDVTAAKDWGNCVAKADIVVNGQVIVKDAPVTYLLFLEKKLVDIHTFVAKLPVLDASEQWHMDEAQNCWASDPIDTARTKKIPRNHVKAEATDKHPAQVEIFHEDVRVGTWRTVKYSGAMPATQVRKLLDRVEALQKAVKFAREEANNTESPEIKVGKAIFEFLFA